VGWREERLAEEAHALLELGRELHERSANAYKAIEDLGRSIRQSVDRFNKLAGSVDKRLTPTLRKFEQAGVKSGKPLVEPTSIDEIPRLLESTPGDDASRA
jgi:DNA recombination protein RmuC